MNDQRLESPQFLCLFVYFFFTENIVALGDSSHINQRGDICFGFVEGRETSRDAVVRTNRIGLGARDAMLSDNGWKNQKGGKPNWRTKRWSKWGDAIASH